MTATVGLGYSMGQHWTGSLLDLNDFDHLDTKFPNGIVHPHHSKTESPKHSNESSSEDRTHFRKCLLRNNLSNAVHLLIIPQIIHTINRKVYGERVFQTSSLGRSKFVNEFQFNGLQHTKVCSGSEPALHVFDRDPEYRVLIDRNPLRIPGLTRRHCNSESDISDGTDSLLHCTLQLNSQAIDDSQGECADIHKDEDVQCTSDSNMEESLNSGEETVDHVDLPGNEEVIDKSPDRLGVEHQTENSALLNLSNEVSNAVPEITNVPTFNLNGCESSDSTPLVSDHIDPLVTEPKRKLSKTVSFADEIGRSLTEVFLLENEDPCNKLSDDDDYFNVSEKRKPATYPYRFMRSRQRHRSSAAQDTLQRTPMEMEYSRPKCFAIPKETTTYEWVPDFAQPATLYLEFRQKLESKCVSLENISVRQPHNASVVQLPYLTGTIKVKNIAYEKQVYIRLTLDHWKTYTEHIAVYNAEVSGALGFRFDTFNFQFTLNPIPINKTYDKIEFAICYVAGKNGSLGSYWDNNDGKNYVIERRQVIIKLIEERIDVTSNTVQANVPQRAYSSANLDTCAISPYTKDYRPNFTPFTTLTNYRAWNHFSGETAYY